MWYGSVSAALELFGPNRYHQDIEGRYSSVNSMLLNKAGILIEGHHGTRSLFSIEQR